MGGCDKTTPALMMGAVSMNLPTIFLPPARCCAVTTRAQYPRLGSDTWKYWAELRAGNITEHDWRDVEDGIARSPGTCMTMGTASTMTSAVERWPRYPALRRSRRRTRATRRWPRSPANALSIWWKT